MYCTYNYKVGRVNAGIDKKYDNATCFYGVNIFIVYDDTEYHKQYMTLCTINKDERRRDHIGSEIHRCVQRYLRSANIYVSR